MKLKTTDKEEAVILLNVFSQTVYNLTLCSPHETSRYFTTSNLEIFVTYSVAYTS